MKKPNITLHLILLASLILGFSSATLAKPSGSHPPAITELTIESYGERMSGLIYQATGAGPHPTVVLLHGYPGNEKNLDVAQFLRAKGWNVVFFHYRGAWGSEGEFSLLNAEADVQVVLNYLSKQDIARKLRVDSKRISLVGHSMGGHMAIAGLLDNPTVQCAIAYDGANLGANGQGLFADPETGELWRNYSNSLFMLAGWSGEKALAEITENAHRLDLTQRAEKLVNRPVLLIAADTQVIPMDVHIYPLHKALSKDDANQTKLSVLNDDHSFSASRDKLKQMTIAFLEQKCRR